MANPSPMLNPTLKDLQHWVMGAAPRVRQMADEIGFIERIPRMRTWDPIRTKVSPGDRIFALVLNVWMGHLPWYRVEDRPAGTDVPLLLGEGRGAKDFGLLNMGSSKVGGFQSIGDVLKNPLGFGGHLTNPPRKWNYRSRYQMMDGNKVQVFVFLVREHKPVNSCY